jgi:D-sedoheptulose 7-phosphate isomerase
LEKIVMKILGESLSVKEAFVGDHASKIILLAEKIAKAFTSDRKLLLCGNGGSAADAQHIAAELVNRFDLERPPLPAIALTTDTSVITSIANDYSFEEIFSKQIKALGMEGDVLVAISTSGNSPNVLSAVRDARDAGIFTAGFIGGDGGKLARLVEIPLIVKSTVTPRIQEAHMLAGHILCRLIDFILFERPLSEK